MAMFLLPWRWQTCKNVGTEAEQALKKGLETAKAEGKTKIKPAHLEGAGEARKQLKTVVVDAFEYSDIDDEAEDFVIIKMPFEQWELLRKAAGLVIIKSQ